MVMQRGAIWWANMPGPSGYRPVVLISRSSSIERRDIVMIAIITSRIRGLPVELKIGLEEGLPKPSAINCDVIMTIPKKDLKKFITTLSPLKLQELNHTLMFSLGLDQ